MHVKAHRRALLALTTVAVTATIAPTTASAALPDKPTRTWMVNGPVRAIAQVGNTIWLGGQFTQLRENVTGQTGAVIPVSNLAAIDATTGKPISGLHLPAVTGNSAIVYALQAFGTRLYVAGRFTSVDGSRRSNLAAIDGSTGHLTAFKPSIGVIWAMTAGAGRLYVGGTFTTANGQSRVRLAAYSLLDGTLDPSWRPSADDRVRGLAVSPDGALVYAVGHFSDVAGSGGSFAARDSVARFTSGSGALDPWKMGCPCSAELFGVGVQAVGDRVYVGMGGSDWVAAVNATTGAQAWHVDTYGELHDVAMMGTRLIIGGHFSWVAPEPGGYVCTSSGNGCVKRLKLAALNVNGVLDPWNPAMTGPYQGVWRLLVNGPQLWAGGEFTRASGVAQERIARFIDL